MSLIYSNKMFKKSGSEMICELEYTIHPLNATQFPQILQNFHD